MSWTPQVITGGQVVEPASLAALVRKFADELDNGDWGTIERIGLALEYDGGLIVHAIGDITDLEQMGMFEAAKLMVFASEA